MALESAPAIEAGVSHGLGAEARLPSSREVARRHGVSPVTASRALQVLRDKGLIRTVDRSGSYLAGAAAAGPAECWALVLRNTPGPWRQASLTFARSGFDAVARSEGVLFQADRFVLDDDAPPRVAQLRRQARDAAAAGIRGVFLMPSRVSDEQMRLDEALVRACREAGLAVVLIERNLRGPGRRLEQDLAAADDVDGGLRCTEHLLESGRRRVAFVAGSPTSSHEGRLAGYLAALQRAGAGQEPLVLEQHMALDTRAAYQDLADRLLRLEADGVVCYQDYTALGLVVELLARGLRVPADVAITGFDNLPIGKAFALGVTTYAFPAEAIASQAVRLMRWRSLDPSAPPVKVLVRGDLVIRESSATA
jgi:LacI family transcriptional regulator